MAEVILFDSGCFSARSKATVCHNACGVSMVAFSRWKKKLDPRRRFLRRRLTMLEAMADFPTPACPFSQRMFGASISSIHSQISFKIPLRVPSRHSCTGESRLVFFGLNSSKRLTLLSDADHMSATVQICSTWMTAHPTLYLVPLGPRNSESQFDGQIAAGRA